MSVSDAAIDNSDARAIVGEASRYRSSDVACASGDKYPP
jgi:hypothetical protein